LNIVEAIANGVEIFYLRGPIFIYFASRCMRPGFSILKAMLKLFLSSKKIDHEMQIKGPIDEKSIDFEGVQCCINKVQDEMESFGKDGNPMFHTKL
jgi:hypothetical protein